MQDHAIYHVWIHFFLPPYIQGERRKTIWSELESNPGPLSSQSTDALDLASSGTQLEMKASSRKRFSGHRSPSNLGT